MQKIMGFERRAVILASPSEPYEPRIDMGETNHRLARRRVQETEAFLIRFVALLNFVCVLHYPFRFWQLASRVVFVVDVDVAEWDWTWIRLLREVCHSDALGGSVNAPTAYAAFLSNDLRVCLTFERGKPQPASGLPK